MAPEQSRRVIIEADGNVRVTVEALPVPGPGEALIRTSKAGICGSDLHAAAGLHPFAQTPYAPGHEVAGVVEVLGPGVIGPPPGTRVLLDPSLVCGQCEACLSGRTNQCVSLRVVGFHAPGCDPAPGGMADMFTARADRLHPVPDEMSDAAAALVEPVATATHAVSLVDPPRHGRVAVLGAGTIGLLTMLTAMVSGATRVAITDVVPDKLARALRLGATTVVDARDPDTVETIKDRIGGRPDVVFDCVATQASLDQAVALALKGGTVVVVGVAERPTQLALPLIQDREVRIQGSALYVRDDVLRALDLVRTGKVPVDEIVTATYPLDRAAEAFAAAKSGHEVKVQISVP